MKNINKSLLLALVVNGGFLLFLLLEQVLSNWIVIGWILTVIVFLYFLSFVLLFIEFSRKTNKGYLYLALTINLLGLMMFMIYWFRL